MLHAVKEFLKESDDSFGRPSENVNRQENIGWETLTRQAMSVSIPDFSHPTSRVTFAQYIRHTRKEWHSPPLFDLVRSGLYRRQVIQPQRLRQQLIHLQDKGLEMGQRNVSL